MKKLAADLLFGKNAMLSGLIALMVVGAIALGCSCNKQLGDLGKNDNSSTTSNSSTDTPDSDSGGVPSDTALQSMVKETTADFAEAIDSNDFHDLYEKSSSDFQATYTEDQFKN